jgi:hypothetical protein
MKTVTVDDHQRVRLPDAKPGQVLALEQEGGKFTLTPVTRQEPKVIHGKLSQDGRTCVMPDGSPVAADSIVDAIKAEREAQTERAIRH